MAQENIKDITLTAAGGTFMFDLFGTSQNVIEVTSSGSITLAANVIINRNIPPMGTLTDTYVKIRWTANVIPNGNTVTILGNVVNSDLLDKDFVMDCYHSPLGWRIKYLVDYASLNTLLSNVDNAGTTLNAAAVYTINSAATQTLVTINLPSDTFTSNGDRIRATITGAFSSDNTVKTLRFGIYDGTNSPTSLSTGVAVDGDTQFTVEYDFIATHVANGEHRYNYKLFYIDFSTGDEKVYVSNVANLAVPVFNYSSGTLQFIVRGIEGTPAGNRIAIHGVEIERIKVS